MTSRERDPVSQVLVNDDLLWIIFSLVKIRSGGKVADLSGFPRVCRAFHGPAAGVIWSDLDGMIPLWHLLAPPKRRPYQHYAYRRIEKYLRTIISSKRYDVPDIMDRFFWYAGLVRSLKSNTPRHVGLQAQLAGIILQRAGGNGFLTGLRTLRCTVSSLSRIETYFLRLSTPALADLAVYINVSFSALSPGEWEEKRNDAPEATHKALNDLSRTAPDLTSISLNAMLDDALTAPLLHFRHLKTIRQVDISTTTTFTLLVTKPGLTSLGVRWKGPPSIVSSASHRRIAQSVDLVELSLRGSCAALAPLLSSIHAPALRRFTLGLGAGGVVSWTVSPELRPADAEYPQCMDALVAAAPMLEELALTTPPSWEISYGDLLAPILPLRGMRRFVYHLCGGDSRHTATDGDLAAAARAWRALQVFRIERMNNSRERSEGPAPTAAALAYFRALCPKLVDLIPPPLDPDDGLSEDGDASKAVVPELGDTAHPLATLRVRLRGMQLSEITAVQRAQWEAYLLRLFPRLGGMEGWEKMVVGEFPDPQQVPPCHCILPVQGNSDDSESSDEELVSPFADLAVMDEAADRAKGENGAQEI